MHLLQQPEEKNFVGTANSCVYVVGLEECSPCGGCACIQQEVFDVIYYELLIPNEIITGEMNPLQLMRSSRVLLEKSHHMSTDTKK